MLLIHLMSSAACSSTTARRARATAPRALLVPRSTDGRELRLREFGSKQAAWVKLLRAIELERRGVAATLGPEAWPDPPPLGGAARRAAAAARALRDQHAIAGIGRSWVDEILWEAQLSPFKRGGDLSERSSAAARGDRRARSAPRSTHYEHAIELPIPDKLPMPLPCTATRASPARAAARRCGGQLRGLRDRLLPGLPDRGPRAQGPAAVAPVEVSARRCRDARRSRAEQQAALEQQVERDRLEQQGDRVAGQEGGDHAQARIA